MEKESVDIEGTLEIFNMNPEGYSAVRIIIYPLSWTTLAFRSIPKTLSLAVSMERPLSC